MRSRWMAALRAASGRSATTDLAQMWASRPHRPLVSITKAKRPLPGVAAVLFALAALEGLGGRFGRPEEGRVQHCHVHTHFAQAFVRVHHIQDGCLVVFAPLGDVLLRVVV